MVSLQPHLTTLLESLPPPPVNQDQLRDIVNRTLQKTANSSSPENRKAAWEYLLKNEIFHLAEIEGTALKDDETRYYKDLCGRLDLVLVFSELEACEPTFPLTVLQDLLETQTISSCSHIFFWIESRAERLTEGMIPQKGKALILLRMLNDLLRRLSKMGSSTMFCGQILTFLSGVFPLGERSGVNLRGEYGSTWEGVQFPDKSPLSTHDMKADDPQSQADAADDDKMQVDAMMTHTPLNEIERKRDFYNTFWSLQLPFSKPPIFVYKDTFANFKESVTKVLPVIKEATAKERAMMGSRAGVNGGTLKRKREPEESNFNEYFFAKFLTSAELLDLEIADTHFRRQFLFQLLVLLTHLANFTKTLKASWITQRNRSLQMDFTLEETDAQWVQETIQKVIEELRQTTPNGRVFADTATTIIEREKNWVKWKNELCTPFDKESWSQTINGKTDLFEATEGIREELQAAPPDWQWSLGTESLTEIWDMGYTSLTDLRTPFQPGDVKDFVKKIKQEDARIALKKQKLERVAKARAMASAEASAIRLEAPAVLRPAPVTVSPLHPSLPPKPGTPAKVVATQENLKPAAAIPAPVRISTPVPPPVPAADSEIAKYEENKQRWAWLALRAARDQYLQHFGRIGTGDIQALAQEIEKGQENVREDGSGGLAIDDAVPGSPNEGDVKMEG